MKLFFYILAYFAYFERDFMDDVIDLFRIGITVCAVLG